MDEVSPRRPGDPPWRSRTAHRSSSPAAMKALRQARQRLGWSITRASQETGVSRPMISQLESGQRRPSRSVAATLIAGYGMSGRDAEAVHLIAREHAGRDSPYRTGVEPDLWDGPEWEPFGETQGNGKHCGEGTERHRADVTTGRAAPPASAEDWIDWARRRAEAARQAPASPLRAS